MKPKTRKNTNSFEKEIVTKLLSLLLTIKLFHWQTHSYSAHKATDHLYDNVNKNMDRFVEVLLGKSGNRVYFTSDSIPVKNISDTKHMVSEIKQVNQYLINLNQNSFMKSMSNSDLFTIRDELLADLNQFLYLLTFQ
jgi:DNA-binding ferritin-like protein